MKENANPIVLRDFTSSDHPFGNREGRRVFSKLLDAIDSNPTVDIFAISLKGIVATDASFPRESVVSIAKQYRGEKAFYLTDLSNRDLIDNWSYAADAKEQPLLIWTNSNYEIIGPDLTSSTKELVDFVIKKGAVTTSQAANALDISVQNASTRLKNLLKQGLVLRSEETAESGGLEYIYKSIH